MPFVCHYLLFGMLFLRLFLLPLILHLLFSLSLLLHFAAHILLHYLSLHCHTISRHHAISSLLLIATFQAFHTITLRYFSRHFFFIAYHIYTILFLRYWR